MHKYLTNILVIFLTLFSASAAISSEAIVKSELEKNAINIGDQFKFSLQLSLPENTPYQWPVFNDTITKSIEIISSSRIDTISKSANNLIIHQDFTLTIFDTGFFIIPPIPFYYGNTFDKVVTSEPFLINVFSVGIDLSQPFKPIIGPMEAPLTFAEVFPWILFAIVAIAMIVFIIRYLKNKKQLAAPDVRRIRPKIPPHKAALEALEKLKNEKLWQRDMIKEYHTRLTDILRQYIEDGFQIPALEMTTLEIIKSFSSVKIESRNLIILRETLEIADLVKFAKYKPLPDAHNKSMTNAIDFVMQTMSGFESLTANENEGKAIAVTEAKNNLPE